MEKIDHYGTGMQARHLPIRRHRVLVILDTALLLGYVHEYTQIWPAQTRKFVVR